MPDILFETRNGVLTVSFNCPEQGNAFTGFMAKTLYEKLKQVAEDRTVRAILLRGNGPHFMNGHDLNGYTGDMIAIQDQIHQKVQFFYTAIRDMQVMEKPLLAAVHGRVSGAGLSLMLACDLVIAGRQTVFNADFTSNAMVPDGGVTFLLPRKIGTARAIEMLMLNEDISAESAENFGLINRVVNDADLLPASLAWAEKVAGGATRTLGAAKRLVAKSFEQDLNAQLSLEASYWNAGTKHFDFREAMKAFVAKRPPKFTGS
jgi:2-(1,2-epoxy-1,2-dihydrophenyl)acetyl-CoA isomerase